MPQLQIYHIRPKFLTISLPFRPQNNGITTILHLRSNSMAPGKIATSLSQVGQVHRAYLAKWATSRGAWWRHRWALGHRGRGRQELGARWCGLWPRCKVQRCSAIVGPGTHGPRPRRVARFVLGTRAPPPHTPCVNARTCPGAGPHGPFGPRPPPMYMAVRECAREIKGFVAVTLGHHLCVNAWCPG